MDDGVRLQQRVVRDGRGGGADTTQERDRFGRMAGVAGLELVRESQSLRQRRHIGVRDGAARAGGNGQTYVRSVTERLGRSDVVGSHGATSCPHDRAAVIMCRMHSYCGGHSLC